MRTWYSGTPSNDKGSDYAYLTFKDTVDIAPRVEYEQELNIINNLRKELILIDLTIVNYYAII